MRARSVCLAFVSVYLHRVSWSIVELLAFFVRFSRILRVPVFLSLWA